MSDSPHLLWLQKADEDLVVSRLVFQEGHLSHTCFLAQQSIEKALKGYLIANESQYPRTHKLVDLLTVCISLEPAFSAFLLNCISVDQYYIPTRYPDAIPGGLPSGTPSKMQAEKAVASAEDVLRFVWDHLSP